MNVTDEVRKEIDELIDRLSRDKVRVLWWDTEVHGEQIFTDNYDGIAHMLKPQGGGGTKVSSVSEFINKENITADCVIVFTDGHLEDKVEWQVNSPTLWLVTMNKDFTAPSGRVVKMEV